MAQSICPECGRSCPYCNPAANALGSAAAAMGSKGGRTTGASKLRNLDYAEIGRKGGNKRWAGKRPVHRSEEAKKQHEYYLKRKAAKAAAKRGAGDL